MIDMKKAAGVLDGFGRLRSAARNLTLASFSVVPPELVSPEVQRHLEGIANEERDYQRRKHAWESKQDSGGGVVVSRART